MLIEETDEIPQDIMEKSKEMGLFALSIPEEYGGLGIGMVGKCARLRGSRQNSQWLYNRHWRPYRNWQRRNR